MEAYKFSFQTNFWNLNAMLIWNPVFFLILQYAMNSSVPVGYGSNL